MSGLPAARRQRGYGHPREEPALSLPKGGDPRTNWIPARRLRGGRPRGNEWWLGECSAGPAVRPLRRAQGKLCGFSSGPAPAGPHIGQSRFVCACLERNPHNFSRAVETPTRWKNRRAEERALRYLPCWVRPTGALAARTSTCAPRPMMP
jgi:hypothetical protein